MIFFSVLLCSVASWGVYSVVNQRWVNEEIKIPSISVPAIIPNKPEENVALEITTGNSYSSKIGETILLPIAFQLSDERQKDLTPYVLYMAYLEGKEWQQIHSEYLSGDTTERTLQIDTGTLDLPPGSYMFVVGLFSSANFSTGASLADSIFELTLIENEDNPDEAYTIAGKTYDKDSTELYLTEINNRGFKKLTNFKQLTVLQVESDELTDISPVMEMNNLRRLYLFSSKLKNVEALKNMTDLTHLGLGGMNINGPGSSGDLYDITSIIGLNRLESLTIQDCQVSDISAVKNLTALKNLWIYKTKISDLSPVVGLSNLTDLRVHYNRITDISCLQSLRKLQFLSVSYNLFPPEQIDDLKSILPDCYIINN